MLKKFWDWVKTAGDDQHFLHLIEWLEIFVAKVLSLAMIGVIVVAVYDLIIFLSTELLKDDYPVFKNTLFEIFGLFLNVLIALEIMANITAYLKKQSLQADLVVITSLIAVARKIIILDLEKKTGLDIIGLGIAIFALSISYWIIKSTNSRHDH